jgi:hypothetical protein
MNGQLPDEAAVAGLQRVMLSPTAIGDIAKSVLVLVQFGPDDQLKLLRTLVPGSGRALVASASG